MNSEALATGAEERAYSALPPVRPVAAADRSGLRVPPRHPRETSRDYALRALRADIVDLSLPPGVRLSENELAEQLGLSRTPVREALMELAKVRLVEIFPQRGTMVSLIDYEMVEETRFMRSVLEGAVVELACQMATEAQLVELADNVSRQERYLEADMPDRLLELDNAFHEMLFRIARKEQTWRMMNGYTDHFDRVRRMSLETVNARKIVADHSAVAQAMRDRDGQCARVLMDKHLSRYRIDEELLRRRYPAEYFKTQEA